MKSLLFAAFLLAATPCVNSAVLQTTACGECVAHCEAYTRNFIHKPMTKDEAISKAVERCHMSRKVGGNAVCGHYENVLNGAFKRQHGDRLYTAETFCEVSEQYVMHLNDAAEIPNMGKGSGHKFKLSKRCKSTAQNAMGASPRIPADDAANFWYSLCVNQDCAHFLPSRTRWCNANHEPTHSAQVCEAMRTFVNREVSKEEEKDFDATQLCGMYKDFVKETHVEYKAYMDVVHDGKVPKSQPWFDGFKSATRLIAVPQFIFLALLAYLA